MGAYKLGKLRDYRNSINHAGYTKNKIKVDSFYTKLENIFKNLGDDLRQFIEIPLGDDFKQHKAFTPAFIHLSSEPFSDEIRENPSLKTKWGIEQFMTLPEDLKKDLEGYGESDETKKKKMKNDLRRWLLENTRINDYIWIQGEPDFIYEFVKWSNFQGLNPIYQTKKQEFQKFIQESS